MVQNQNQNHKPDPIDLYIQQIEKLILIPETLKTSILKELRLDIQETMRDSKANDPALAFGLPRKVAGDISLNHDWTEQKVGFGIRTVAYLIDLFLSLVLVIVLIGGLYVVLLNFVDEFSIIYQGSSITITPISPLGYILFLFASIWSIIVAVVAGGYSIIFEGLFSTTIGKRFFRLWVVDYSGIKITWTQAFIRTISKIFTTFLIFDVIIGIIQKSEHQRAMDKVAETYVIKIEQP